MHWIYAHLIGDFIIQSDWMAKYKKSDSFACLIHILTYLFPFAFVDCQWWQLSLIAVQHYYQDRTNFVFWFMKRTGSEGFAKDMAPWSTILIDQILHILFMAFVFQY